MSNPTFSRIDAELINKFCKDMGIEVTPPVTLTQGGLEDYIFESSKTIIKAIQPRAVVRKNAKGFSVSLRSDTISQVYNFFENSLFYNRIRCFGEYDTEVMRICNNCHSFLDFYYFSTVPASFENHKIIMQINFKNANFYENFNVYSILCEIIHILEYFDTVVQRIPVLQGVLEANSAAYAEREEAARKEREALEAAQREEQERRARLLASGFSEKGVELSKQLKDLLERSKAKSQG